MKNGQRWFDTASLEKLETMTVKTGICVEVVCSKAENIKKAVEIRDADSKKLLVLLTTQEAAILARALMEAVNHVEGEV